MIEGSGPTRTDRLPRGPHGLPREEVERSQRERLLAATADAVADKGYAATSVEDILKRAKVSRTTFYQLYGSKLDCFLAASRMAAELVALVMSDELARLTEDRNATPVEKLDRLLDTYLRTLAENPALARVFLVEVYAAGAEAIGQRRDSLDLFVDMATAIVGDFPGGLGGPGHQRFAAQVLVDAISSRVTTMVGVGETPRLLELRQPLMEFIARFMTEAPTTARGRG